MPKPPKPRGKKPAAPESRSIGSQQGRSRGHLSKSARRRRTQHELSMRIQFADEKCSREKLLCMLGRLRKGRDLK